VATRTTGTLRIVARSGHPDFLDLPWSTPLSAWADDRLVEVARGLHRNVVRFVDYDGRVYALKELPGRIADREYRILRRLAEAAQPAVEAVGVVGGRAGDGGEALNDVLITRYLDYSLPYRTLFTHARPAVGADAPDLTARLLDALAMLLVRLHLAGFFWGDCSLSNTLFRRDAGALAAYIVDMETGEWHPQLSDGQRRTELEITEVNVAGGLMDLQAELGLPPEPDPVDTATDLTKRYERLWRELTSEQVIRPSERHEIETRIRRLNELGFDVDEIEVVGSGQTEHLTLRTFVSEQGFHRRRLHSLTGLEAQENQARSLLNDLANFRTAREREQGRSIPEQVAAYLWLNEVFEPTVTAVPEELRGRVEPAEMFHEIIEHKWLLSEQAGHDVGVDEAVRSYIEHVLPGMPAERLVVTDDAASGWIGFG
jgi:hypothetical protein